MRRLHSVGRLERRLGRWLVREFDSVGGFEGRHLARGLKRARGLERRLSGRMERRLLGRRE